MTMRSRLVLTIICFVLGLSLVAQLRGRRGQSLAGVPSQDRSVILGGLVVANAELRSEVLKLQGEIQAYDQASERAAVPQMAEELGHMRIVNGHVEVVGPGVEVTVGAGVTVVNLQDILNEVRNVGAEAISLNGQRLAVDSALISDEQGIIVEGVRIEPPFTFQAIGDPTTMSTALNRRGGVLEQLGLYYPGLAIQIKTVPLMDLPARSKSKQFALAKPVKPAQ